MSHDQFDPYREWLGIQPHEHPVDHYRLLGVARFESNFDLISNAADERMGMIRKFQTGPRGSHTQQILNQLSSARGCLLSPQDKAQYDAQLQAAMHAAQQEAAQLQAAQAAQMQAAQMQATQLLAQMQANQMAAQGAAPPPVAPPAAAPPTQDHASEHSEHHEDERYEPQVSGSTTWVIITLACVLGVVAVGCAAYVVISKARRNKPVVVENPGGVVEVDPIEPVQVVPMREKPDEQDGRTSIMQEANGNVVLPLSVVKLQGDAIQLVHQGGEDVINQWTSLEDVAEWDFRLVKPGFFRVEIQYGATGDAVGSEFVVEVADKKANFEVLDSGAFTLYKNEYRVIAIPRSGEHTLSVRAKSMNGSQLMVLKSIELVPVKR